MVGHVFPEAPPAWAEGAMWAPEITYEDGKTYICYTARKKDGPLCVAMASADDPHGPYTDHGPLIGQDMGSIDGYQVRDGNGQIYLIWKEDGNAYQVDTPIYAQAMNEARTELYGPVHSLLSNDKSWEGALVEGPTVIHRGEYFYMFYAGNGCCGKCCTYATGVARAKSLLGPWEKHPRNPIMRRNKNWKCPGHGTVTTFGDRWVFLHHAYHHDSHEFVGRQSMFSEFIFDEKGWPAFEKGSPQAEPLRDYSILDVVDEFNSPTLDLNWEWPFGQKPIHSIENGSLLIEGSQGHGGNILARKTHSTCYHATTELNLAETCITGKAGIGVIGDPGNLIAMVAAEGVLQLLKVRGGEEEILCTIGLGTSRKLILCVEAQPGNGIHFSWQQDDGDWKRLADFHSEAVDGSYLPPWDRGLRVGLVSYGPEGSFATFRRFQIDHR